MTAEQLDLFATPAPPLEDAAPPLNGFYYERSTDKFVSFVLGRRYFEISTRRCQFPKDWQEKMKQERAI